MNTILKSGMETTIIYKKFISSVYDDATGMNFANYDEYEIKTVKVDASLQAQMASSILAGISFGAGTIIYLLKQSDMPRTNLYSSEVLKDFVVDNGVEKQVKTAIPLLDVLVKIQV